METYYKEKTENLQQEVQKERKERYKLEEACAQS